MHEEMHKFKWVSVKCVVRVGVCLFFVKECCFKVKHFFNECCFRVRVRVRVRVDTNPNPKTKFSKKKIDHGRALNPAFY